MGRFSQVTLTGIISDMIEELRHRETATEEEVRKAIEALASVGVNLTQDQRRIVDSLSLRQKLKQSPEVVFCRFDDRINRLGFAVDAKKIFSSFLMGVLTLEGDDALIEQCLRIDELNDDEFSQGVTSFVQQTPGLLNEYQVSTLQEAFEKIKERGRTKVYVWNYSSNSYQLLESLTEEQLSVLPWGGTIQVGGSTPIIQGTLTLARDLSFEFGFASLSINGIDFSLPENDDHFSLRN